MTLAPNNCCAAGPNDGAALPPEARRGYRYRAAAGLFSSLLGPARLWVRRAFMKGKP